MKKTRSLRLTSFVVLVTSVLGSGWPAVTRAQESATPAPAMAPAAGEVARAVFARAIVEREPQEVVAVLDTNAEQIFFFTELIGMEGRTVTHRWELGGQVMAEVPFVVGAPRWRVHSSKRLLPDQDGSWTVSVVDEAGRTLRSETLGTALVSPAQPPTPPAAPAQ